MAHPHKVATDAVAEAEALFQEIADEPTWIFAMNEMDEVVSEKFNKALRILHSIPDRIIGKREE